MANDREQELERLEKELLADMAEDDDLLADIPMQLLDTTPATWDSDDVLLDEALLMDTEEPAYEAEFPEEEDADMKKPETSKAKPGKKKEDKAVNILMIIASFLCLGIIGVLIYWLEAFFK